MSNESQVDSGFYVGGTGSELVLLHGLGGTWHIWKPVLPLLERHHRVIALTLPGHDGGCTMSPATEPTVGALADLLVAELQKHGIVSAHVVGNSLGGWLALELARRGLARSVIVFSPAGAWNSRQDYRKLARAFGIAFALLPIVIAMTTLFLGSASLRRLLGGPTMEHADRIPAGDFRAMLRAMARTRILPGLLKTMGHVGPVSPLPAGRAPIRIVWGERDQFIPFERYGRPMVERIAAAEQMMLPGVGHVPMYDDPEAGKRGNTASDLSSRPALERRPTSPSTMPRPSGTGPGLAATS